MKGLTTALFAVLFSTPLLADDFICNLGADQITLNIDFPQISHQLKNSAAFNTQATKKESLLTYKMPTGLYQLDLKNLLYTYQPSGKPLVKGQCQRLKPLPKSTKPSCGTKRYCTQMDDCDEAKHYLNHCGLDKLDQDGDGTPCEKICS